MREARMIAGRMLRGVGRGADIVEAPHPDAIAIHVRRLSTFGESAVVGGARDVRPRP